MTEIIGLILIIGSYVGFYLWHTKKIKDLEFAHENTLHNAESQNQSLANTLQSKLATIQNLEFTLKEAQNAFQTLEKSCEVRLADMQNMCEMRIKEEKSHSQTMIQTLQEQFNHLKQEQEKAYEKSKEEMKNTFKALSAEILQQNTQTFNQHQVLSLQPLKEQIERFSHQLTQNYADSTKQNTALLTQIEQLHKLNHQISTEAQNLTNALKSNNKIQGNWGEMILQKVLENSGLQEGREYELQQSLQNDDAKLIRPDAIIKLPKSGGEERCVVVDSKTSLIAYERLCNAENEIERQQAQKELSESIKAHFKGLSEKTYHHFLKGQKLDFVLMFIPIEGAFLEAMHYDMKLYEQAYQKGVVLVSPTTIMAVLRIIHNLWQFEHRNANMEAIFTEIHKLFEGINRFDKVLEKIGKNITTIKTSYDDLMKKYNGQQGIAGKSEHIRKLLQGSGFDQIEKGGGEKERIEIELEDYSS